MAGGTCFTHQADVFACGVPLLTVVRQTARRGRHFFYELRIGS
jgi:hypothetical protein